MTELQREILEEFASFVGRFHDAEIRDWSYHRERLRAEKLRKMERVRADPARLARYRLTWRAEAKRNYERMKRDPARWMRFLSCARRTYARIKADPVRYAARRAYAREMFQRLKADPVRYAAYLERSKLRKREYRAAQRAVS